MLKLTHGVYKQIKAHGAASYPHEGCGLLLGYVEDGVNVVTAVQPMQNIWPVEAEKPTRFRIAEDDWRDAELEAMLNGLDVVGVFHSHPDNPPVASPRDRAWAAWTGYSYLITQVNNGDPSYSRSWQLKQDRSGFIEEPITEITLMIENK
ncbi:MAG: M67 family metallopeptidase [Anaerolineales bacterium]|nr:M67 family metallopeptidase [Anaerolineales bacterium]